MVQFNSVYCFATRMNKEQNLNIEKANGEEAQGKPPGL